jgi:hypothetical protein
MTVNKTKQFLKLGYEVPDKYFDLSKQQMLDRVLMSYEQKTIVRPLWKKFSEFAAVFVLLLTIKWSIDVNIPSTTSGDSDYGFLLVESVLVDEKDFDVWFEENYVLDVF